MKMESTSKQLLYNVKKIVGVYQLIGILLLFYLQGNYITIFNVKNLYNEVLSMGVRGSKKVNFGLRSLPKIS
ncbi:hypothetical protein QX51_18115 [Terrisporobacter othiniensis]|uniref:Uncharacterized protein n=1 Tax=Terrisporobacter othiniensis TaxID=1577792 RepID=A0A0B3VFS4_9FIRM|nr:hypothetical protein QX51_18115 [Terrisporobacter othiniensis]